MSEFSVQGMLETYKTTDPFTDRDELSCSPDEHLRIEPDEVNEARELVGYALDLSDRVQGVMSNIHMETSKGRFGQGWLSGLPASTFDNTKSENGSRSRPLIIRDASYAVECGDLDYPEFAPEAKAEAVLSYYGIRQTRARSLLMPWKQKQPNPYSAEVSFYATDPDPAPETDNWIPLPLQGYKLRTAHYGYLANYLPEHTPKQLGYDDVPVRTIGASVLKEEIEGFESVLNFLEERIEEKANVLRDEDNDEAPVRSSFFNFVIDPAPWPGDFR